MNSSEIQRLKLHLAHAGGLHQITSCGPGYIAVNGVRHASSIVVTPAALDPAWGVASLADLTDAAVAALLRLTPELALIGTGARLQFPPTPVLRPLIDANVGYEIMDTGAACRTYNILMAEGRKVLAALIVEP